MKTCILFLLLASASLLSGQVGGPEATQELADRYEQMLVRSPQPGPAFDRVIEWYSTKGGGLEKLDARWEAAPDEAGAYLVLRGLLAERLRNPDRARELYSKATDRHPAAARLLAALETTEGNFPAAAAAYEKALAAESLPPVERMDLMRSLALLHQRSFHDQKAVDVWREALRRFPEDPFVMEEAGEAFLSAGDYEEAAKTFTRLRDASANDPFRKVSASLRLARTAELAGQHEEAVAIYDAALAETSEGSWIHREIRARLEDLFRRRDDLPGLLAFYEKRTAADPQDVLSLAAQAEVLADLGRGPEAVDRLRAAAALAPGNLELRLDLVRRLQSENRIDDALGELRELARPADADPVVVTLLGEILWKQFTDSGDAAKRSEALAVWERLAPLESTYIARLSALADLLQAKGEIEGAMTRWQRLLTLAPEAADVRQKLAEAFTAREDRAAAEKVLAEMIEGDRATAENFVALARIQTRLEWDDAARETLQRAVEKFPDHHDVLSAAFRNAMDSDQSETLAALFPRVWALAPNEFFATDLVKQYAAFLTSRGLNKEKAAELSGKLTSGLAVPDLLLLFQLAVAANDEKTARAVRDALAASDDPVRAARAAADFAAAFSTPDEQVATLRRLAEADPRLASECLTSIARIQATEGDPKDALATMSQLIERTPSDGALYRQYAEIASRAGKLDEAVARLREGIRYVDEPAPLRLMLADYLGMQGRTDEAEKALQEAFEAEDKEPRRLEIFRRQAELAAQTGRFEQLIASLRERQAKEQGGGRYGAYLAEIFIQQNDLLAAGEELSRSLGRNPDDPAAVARLLDLATRSGDREESLRLSARLAELEPTRENRAAYLTRLFESADRAKALEEFAKVRADVLKDPAAWNSVLLAMHQAGFSGEADALVDELAADPSSGPAIRYELAMLRLLQRRYDEAETILSGILAGSNFGEALLALTSQAGPQNPFFSVSPSWARFQPMQFALQQVSQSLMSIFSGYRGGFSRMWGFGLGSSRAASGATPDQIATVRSFFVLSALARAQDRYEAFAKFSDELVAKAKIPLDLRMFLATSLQDTEAQRGLIREAAASDGLSSEVLGVIVEAPAFVPDDPETATARTAIRKKMADLDPAFGFRSAVQDFTSEFGQDGGKVGTEAWKKRFAALLEHPGNDGSITHLQTLTNLAVQVGEFETAAKLLEQAGQAAANSPVARAQMAMIRAGFVRGAIEKNRPDAQKVFEEFLGSMRSQAPGSSRSGFPMHVFGGFGRAGNPLVQQGGELAVGDSEFSVDAFRLISAGLFQAEAPSKLREWFSSRSADDRLDVYAIGVFYTDWFAGDREKAVKRLAELHAKAPSARSAALLLEASERMNRPDEALAVIEAAAMQSGETPDLRELRRIRLLRQAKRNDEAREAAKRLAKTRLSLVVREQLAGELNQLGIPPSDFTNLNTRNTRRPSPDRSNQLQAQLSKLNANNQKEEATRIASGLLLAAFPGADDYQQWNLRGVAVNALRESGGLAAYRDQLTKRLEADPGDFEAALRLGEIIQNPDDRTAANHLVRIASEHPERIQNARAWNRVLERSQNQQSVRMEVVATLLEKRPDVLARSAIGMEEILNMADDDESAARLALALVATDDASYNQLFVASRLADREMEPMLLARLSDVLVKTGKTDAAVTLLQRGRSRFTASSEQSVSLLVRLAELQLELGQNEAAAETMKTLLEPPRRPGFRRMRGVQVLAGVLLQSSMNRFSGSNPSAQIERIGEIAERTGTLDLLLEKLENEDSEKREIPTSLLVRTVMNRPGVAAEWGAVAMKSDKPLNELNLPMLTTVLLALAPDKNASKWIPAILRRIPEQNYVFGGGDYHLSLLVEILPKLSPLRKNPLVARHIDQLLSRTLSDPNAAQYLPHSESYAATVSALLDAGMVTDARRLLDFTSASRASRNFGRSDAIGRAEARLRILEGGKADVQVVCAAAPAKDSAVRVRWKAQIALPQTDPDRARNQPVGWETANIEIPVGLRPTRVEIWAGKNPAVLERAATVSKPELSGEVQIKTESPVGLVQARWRERDGRWQNGPLTAYVTGENLLPAQKPAIGMEVREGVPGPLGATSASEMEAVSASSELNWDIASIPIGKEDEVLVFSGWFAPAGSRQSAPGLGVDFLGAGGRLERDSFSSGDNDGVWVPQLRMWSVANSSGGIRKIPDGATTIALRLIFRAFSSFNSMWTIGGRWDGLQLVRIPSTAIVDAENSEIGKARTAFNKREFGPAADLFSKAFRESPHQTLRQGTSFVKAFSEAGRLPELFSMLSNPALLLPDPLRNNSPVLGDNSVLEMLAREATGQNAPPEAAPWLNLMSTAALPEHARRIVSTALLRARAQSDPSSVSAADVLEALGIGSQPAVTERIRAVWSSEISQSFDLFDMLQENGRGNEALEAVRRVEVPGDALMSRQLLEAWIQAPTEPQAALETWSRFVALREAGKYPGGYSEETDSRFLRRLAAYHPEPDAVLTAIRQWNSGSRSDAGYQQRRLAETIYALTRVESKYQPAYRAAWVDSEVQAFGSGNRDSSIERLRELSQFLIEAGDWKKLETLLSNAEKVPALQSSNPDSEVARLRNLAALASGRLENAWPVVWASPPDEKKTVQVGWQWNLREIRRTWGKFDLAISVSAVPPVKEIPGQTAVEIHFGEMPGEMTLLKSVPGDSSSGQMTVALPAACGFLRAIAVVGDERRPGPLVPVVSGLRVFPPPGGSLPTVLLEGERPLAAGVVKSSGQAPDGSPAVRIGTAGERQNLNYTGTPFPIEPGKFYFNRGWVQRTGTGSVMIGAEFRAKPGSNAGALNMILTERREPPGRWVLFSRAIPSFPQHTFWIPFREVGTMVPVISDITPGTEIAGLEILEAAPWKYADWLGDLAMARYDAGEEPDEAAVDRVLALSAIEPLTALDYQGDWLARFVQGSAQGMKLVGLFESAFRAEPNPLFARPKYDRMFGYMDSFVRREDLPIEVRLAGVKAGLALSEITSHNRRVTFLLRWLAMAPAGEMDRVKAEIRQNLQALFAEDPNAAALASLIESRRYENDRPVSSLLQLANLAQDPALNEVICQAMETEAAQKRLPVSHRELAPLAFQASVPEWKPGSDWQEAFDAALAEMDRTDQLESAVFWAHLLGTQIGAHEAGKALLIPTRQRVLQRACRAPERAGGGRPSEVVRSLWFLVEDAVAADDLEAARGGVKHVVEWLKTHRGNLQDETYRMAFATSSVLERAGLSDQARELITSLEYGLKNFPKWKDASAPYLTPPTGGAAPGGM